jgi:hypothetical protein
MKKRGIWVKVKPAVGLYHLRFDVSLFTDESRADVIIIKRHLWVGNVISPTCH